MPERPLRLELENVGGIDHTKRTLTDGITLIQGPNASNKSSFLRGLLFALGAETVPIQSGADEARAVLAIGEKRAERRARRTEVGIETTGEAWITDSDDVRLLERFAGLLETNSLRSAIARNEDVESLLKEPMDIEALEARREEKLRRKRTLSQEVAATGDVDVELAERDAELAEKRERLAELREAREALHDEQDATITDDGLEPLREERAELRSREAENTTQISQLEAAIDRLERRKADIDRELEAARETRETYDVEELERKRETLRSELADTRRRVELLQSVLTANREMVASEFTGVLGQDSGLVTDAVTCWACGRSAPTERFEETIDELTELVGEDKRRVREAEPEIEEVTELIEEVRESEVEIEELEADKADVERRLEDRRESLAERRDQLADIRDSLEDVDSEIAAFETDQQSENAELTDEIETVRADIQTTEREVRRLEDERDSLRETRADRRRKREEIDELTEEIAALTDRIENLEAELQEVFNETMDDLLDVLSFDHVERVWLDGTFDLVIAREVDDRVRTDTIDHLAESEREMIGLVLALAGFVTYDVDEVSPVLVLDSLGAFDADRTRRLVEYFADETDYLVASAHPELDLGSGFDIIPFDPTEQP